MAGKKRLHSSRPLNQELPQPKDSLGSLPNTCVYTILEHFTAVELIGMRRVSCGWKDAVDWKLGSILRKCRPELAEVADEEQATLEFRREIFRQEAWNSGRPAFARRFTRATQGFAMCGDYFCWIDDTCLNVQLVFNSNKTRRFPRVERYRLTWLLGVDSLSVETVKPQEVGSITDRPLLMIKYAGKRKEDLSARDEPISPRQSGTALWSTAHDEPLHSSAPWGKLVTLNHTALAYITHCELSLGPTLCVRDVLTGQIKATKLIPADLRSFPLSEKTLIQLHPRRDLVYIAVHEKAFFFSATTANSVGRLSDLNFYSSLPHEPENHPLRPRFGEHQPKCSPTALESFFLCKYDAAFGFPAYCCSEFEIPTDEDLSISEARILQSGDHGSQENLIFTIRKIQIYEHHNQGTEGPPELNPMLKRLAHSEIGMVRRKRCTWVRFPSFKKRSYLPWPPLNILVEPYKGYKSGTIPIEFYTRRNMDVIVTKPERAPARHARNKRVDCILPKPFVAPITLTERYMLLAHEDDVYLFAYEPRW